MVLVRPPNPNPLLHVILSFTFTLTLIHNPHSPHPAPLFRDTITREIRSEVVRMDGGHFFATSTVTKVSDCWSQCWVRIG